MTEADRDLEWDEGATQLRAEPVGPEDDDAETSLHSPPVQARPAPHRTREEAEDTASAELAPLRLDPTWSRAYLLT